MTICACLAVWLVVYTGHALAQPEAGTPHPPRVVSIDMCADEYALGLVPRSQILGVSKRSQLPASHYRARAAGIRRILPSLETLLALQPDIVVRTWEGDARLVSALEAHGIKVVTINEFNAYDQAEAELLWVGHELGQDAYAQAEAQRFKAALDDVRPIGLGRTVLYYAPSAYSAGPDTMVGDILQRLDFRLETQDKGFFYLSPEVLLSLKPDVFALGFYEDRYAMRRVPGRNPLVRKLIAETPHMTLPESLIACSGWYTAYDLQALSMTTVK